MKWNFDLIGGAGEIGQVEFQEQDSWYILRGLHVPSTSPRAIGVLAWTEFSSKNMGR